MSLKQLLAEGWSVSSWCVWGLPHTRTGVCLLYSQLGALLYLTQPGAHGYGLTGWPKSPNAALAFLACAHWMFMAAKWVCFCALPVFCESSFEFVWLWFMIRSDGLPNGACGFICILEC